MGITINLTQHAGTLEQGVVEPTDKGEVVKLLTFENLPSKAEMTARAQALAAIAHEAGADSAMIGGAPFFMSTLERELEARGIRPLYAFSLRESTESVQPDGSVRKTQVFRHVGYVPAAGQTFEELVVAVRRQLDAEYRWWLECHSNGDGECDDRTQNSLSRLVAMELMVREIFKT